MPKSSNAGRSNMTELDLYRAFFHRWEEFHLLPKAPGRKSKEHEEAAKRMIEAAQQIKGYVPPSANVPVVSADTQEFRALQQQIAAIPPKLGTVKALV